MQPVGHMPRLRPVVPKNADVIPARIMWLPGLKFTRPRYLPSSIGLAFRLLSKLRFIICADSNRGSTFMADGSILPGRSRLAAMQGDKSEKEFGSLTLRLWTNISLLGLALALRWFGSPFEVCHSFSSKWKSDCLG